MSERFKYTGLTDRQAEESRKIHGANILKPAEKESLLKKFLEKFGDPLIIILLVAGGLSICISLYEYFVDAERNFMVFFEPLGIFVAILLATGLSFIFEAKADREFELLNRVNDDEPVTVMRNGKATTIPKREIVVGDIVLLNTGEEIPADGELLEATSLSVDESTLTGEPIAYKTTNPKEFDREATFPSNRVYRNTKVMEGHGVQRVLAVGESTEHGKVFEATRIDTNVKTPLAKQLDGLGKLISKISYGFAIAIVAGRVLMYFLNEGFEWIDFIAYLLQSVMLAVTLIVVAVPEGLPMAVTLSLAYSMRRMLKTKNLVRKLHACETMGAATVICTDKTGTLTQNRMQVFETNFFMPKEELPLVYEGIAVNSTAQLDFTTERTGVLGNPTEGALLLWLRTQGIDYLTLRKEVKTLQELPFTTERKYMATVVEHSDGRRILYVKGAPEIVFGMCQNTYGTTGREVEAQLLAYQNQAMRTLGFAFQILEAGEEAIVDGKVRAGRLNFAGFVAISDPVRADVPEAVSEVLDAGIKVKIVTGDTPGTAKEVGRRIGLWDDATDGECNIITGLEFESLSDGELKDRVDNLKIIARARPMDKKRLVEALQNENEIVAVTGDGTNDAPALKKAHVGLSMGEGTSVAKEASDITIIDNSFSSIGRAVMWGRSLYKNIQRFILFQMTVNVAACFIVLFGAFMGTESPLTVTQMLWVNLIMDTLAAVALASLPPSSYVMKEKPRGRGDFIISKGMWRSIVGVGGIFFLFLLALLFYFQNTEINSLTEIGKVPFGPDRGDLSPYELSLFFTIFVFLQFWNMFNARAFASGRSAFHFKDCGSFGLIVLLILGGQILIVTFGGEFFTVVPLKITDWVLIAGGTSIVLWIGELIRLFTPRKGRQASGKNGNEEMELNPKAYEHNL